MKLMMGIVLLTLFVDNLERQGRSQKRPRKKFGPPRIGRSKLYDRVLQKIMPPLTRGTIRERRRP